jgi:hypothetical protein
MLEYGEGRNTDLPGQAAAPRLSESGKRLRAIALYIDVVLNPSAASG